MCNNAVTEILNKEVSIRNVNKALAELRTYGLSEKRAIEILEHESIVAIQDNNIIPDESMAPFLIECFGEPHVEDALTYSYLFLSNHKDILSYNIYPFMIGKLLEAFEPEELISNPERIRLFINNLDSEAIALMIRENGVKSISEYRINVLEDLGVEKTREMTESLDTTGFYIEEGRYETDS